jgi:DNA helicase-2/ATP-dependent DNA helicase PcrA
LNLFYDHVLIDEFQDFREYDYDLIMALSKQLNDVVLVGDYYQHSVSAVNNSGRPFQKKSVDVSYDAFVDELQSAGFEVDTTTLDKSRRCSIDVCEFVSSQLGINITFCGKNVGSVIWVDENAPKILENQSIIKLVYQDAARYTFQAMNWSYSKGDTVNAACVILTKNFERLPDDEFSTKQISTVTRNKLYVAMTRSCGDLYLMRSSIFKELRDSYIKT